MGGVKSRERQETRDTSDGLAVYLRLKLGVNERMFVRIVVVS